MSGEHAFAALDLSGRTAVVTGAASGIGRATAILLARAGANLVLGDVQESGLGGAAAEVKEAGAGVAQLRTDVSSAADVEALVERAVAEFGRLDVMANIAGVLSDSRVADLEEADLDRILAVNLKGVFFGCRAAVRAMGEGPGSIVNMASSAAFAPYPTLSAYSASKAGVVALTRSVASEVARRRIRVNAIAPGMVDTPMVLGRGRAVGEDERIDPERREAALAAARERNPLGIAGRPEDIAHAVLFLASDASRYMTGQVLHPNGGAPMV